MGRTKVKKPKTKEAATKEATVIEALIRAKNGPTNCSKWLASKLKKPKFNRQNIVNWRVRGYVPLEMLREIADAFGVSPYLLNWDGYIKVTGETPPSWSKLVAEYKVFK